MRTDDESRAAILQAVAAIDASKVHDYRARLMTMFWGWFTSDFAECKSTVERDHYFITIRSLVNILDAIEGVDSGIT